MCEEGAKLSGLDLAPEHVDDLLPEPAACYTVQQEVGAGVEVVQHVSHIADDVDRNGVVVAVVVFMVVFGAQDAVGDKAWQAENHEGHRDNPKQQQRPAGRTSSSTGPDRLAFLFSEETTGAEQLVRDQRVKDDDEQDGNSTGQEGRDPDHCSGVEGVSIKTTWNHNSLSILSQIHLENGKL